MIKAKKKLGWFEWLAILLVVACAVKFLIIDYFYMYLTVQTKSMYPTIIAGEKYRFIRVTDTDDIKRFDIASFMLRSQSLGSDYKYDPDCPTALNTRYKCYLVEEVPYVKRIVGMPHDTIKFNDNAITINGQFPDYKKMTDKEPLFDLSGNIVAKPDDMYAYKVSFEGENFTILTFKSSEKLLGLKGEITLGENEYFLMGDNRNKSHDSRSFGAINGSDIRFIYDKQNN